MLQGQNSTTGEEVGIMDEAERQLRQINANTYPPLREDMVGIMDEAERQLRLD
ncbi:hypothetical protein MFUM_700029 [Methylacidiphilum fumariolicum SolV]|uniref:Uncharacterized protein n=2 Tax=Candidatus Methylacidiphilum fumarolicum TaxID=591154 RepID=I0JZ11_METFB|nr:conserved protein of unknown function [Candidatus Methylacidiphilum fumarolicum]CCG92480.1 hypothetical protein MFUM_700029 [Methylacidiphilum fumariolicum SolV]